MPPARRRFRGHRPFTARNTGAWTQSNNPDYITSLDQTQASLDTSQSSSTKEELLVPTSPCNTDQKKSCVSPREEKDFVRNANKLGNAKTKSERGKLRRRSRRPRSNLRGFSSSINSNFNYSTDLDFGYKVVNHLPDSTLASSRQESSDGLASTDVDSDNEQSISLSSLNDENASLLDSFSIFRLNYLIVHIGIMLADGLQGTPMQLLIQMTFYFHVFD